MTNAARAGSIRRFPAAAAPPPTTTISGSRTFDEAGEPFAQAPAHRGEDPAGDRVAGARGLGHDLAR